MNKVRSKSYPVGFFTDEIGGLDLVTVINRGKNTPVINDHLNPLKQKKITRCNRSDDKVINILFFLLRTGSGSTLSA